MLLFEINPAEVLILISDHGCAGPIAKMTVTAIFWPKGICSRRSHGLKSKLAPLPG
jgi:hypothetical protein